MKIEREIRKNIRFELSLVTILEIYFFTLKLGGIKGLKMVYSPFVNL
jgi:hypothetical protein